ncbi:SRPBCC family protein [Pseudonocardia sp. GCM10023141]|uniref:SRPBCC family protein n=1 Tax=Pseudonocardia sp. GCM10023141 TaxID=3252653 RepID=UPI00360B7F67
MRPWFALAACDADFLTTAPHRYAYPIDLPVPAERVWADLASETPLSWCRMLGRITWTSPPPHGIGATRTVPVGVSVPFGGPVVLKERYFRWDEGQRRHSFAVEQASVPALHRFAEDYLVEETAAGCRLTWTFAFEPKPWAGSAVRLARPAVERLFTSFERDTVRHYDSVVSPGR